MTDPQDVSKKSVKAKKSAVADSSTQRYLPFSEIRDNLMIMKDGSSRMVLKVSSVNFNLKSEQEQDSIIIGYQRFLNALRFPIQIIVRSLKVDIESYIYKLKNIAVKQSNPLLQEQTYQYINFLVNLIDMAQIMKKDFYVVVPFDTTVDNASVRQMGTFGIFKSLWASLNQEDNITKIREKRARIDVLRKGNRERLTTIKTNLESIGLKSEEMKKDDLIKLLIAYYNPKITNDSKLKGSIDEINIEK